MTLHLTSIRRIDPRPPEPSALEDAASYLLWVLDHPPLRHHTKRGERDAFARAVADLRFALAEVAQQSCAYLSTNTLD